LKEIKQLQGIKSDGTGADIKAAGTRADWVIPYRQCGHFFYFNKWY